MAVRVKLNPIDDVIALFDDAMRADGQPGFNCVAVVVVAGRLDAARLQRAADRVARRHPLTTARLQRRPWAWRPRWVVPSAGAIPVHVAGDGGGDGRSPGDAGDVVAVPPSAIAAFAAGVLNRALDPRVDPPVQVFLHRGAGGRDLVGVQWSHVLTDARGGDFLAKELGRAYAEDAGVAVEAMRLRPLPVCLPVGAPRWPMKAARAGGVFRPLGGRPEGPSRIRLATLDAAEGDRVRREAARVAGFGRQGLFVLAAYLRAMSREARGRGQDDDAGAGRTPVPQSARVRVRTQWPVGLRDGASPEALPANEYGLLPIEHEVNEDVDMAALVDRLTRQIVAALGAGTQWRLWQTGRWLRTTFFPVLCRVNRMTRFLMRGSGLTTHFRYAGRLLGGARTWGGLPVEGGCVAASCYPESPVAVGFSETAGRFHIGVTWLDGAITEATADRLIEALRAELGGGHRAGG